jgi:hypothetical protein
MTQVVFHRVVPFAHAAPKDHAIIAEIDGYVRFTGLQKQRRTLSPRKMDIKVEYKVPMSYPCAEGDSRKKGDCYGNQSRMISPPSQSEALAIAIDRRSPRRVPSASED